ncbi:MAG TPA: hypothetical protein VGJ11_10365, partial [Gaiellales bacterium]
ISRRRFLISIAVAAILVAGAAGLIGQVTDLGKMTRAASQAQLVWLPALPSTSLSPSPADCVPAPCLALYPGICGRNPKFAEVVAVALAAAVAVSRARPGHRSCS